KLVVKPRDGPPLPAYGLLAFERSLGGHAKVIAGVSGAKGVQVVLRTRPLHVSRDSFGDFVFTGNSRHLPHFGRDQQHYRLETPLWNAVHRWNPLVNSSKGQHFAHCVVAAARAYV